MEGPRIALLVAAAAALLAVAGLAAGALGALLAGPVALALGALAFSLRGGPGPASPRRLVALGMAAAGLALALAFAAPAPGALALLAALGSVLCGTQLALRAAGAPPAAEPTPRADAGLHAAAALDECALAWRETARLLRPAPPFERIAAEVRAAGDRNLERGWFDRPELSHPFPPPLEKPSLVRREMRGGGRLEHLSFASEYEPPDPEVRDDLLEVRANGTAHVYLRRHRDGPRATLVCLHGHELRHPGLDPRGPAASWLHEDLGLDLAVLLLPLSGPRAAGRAPALLDAHPLWASAAVGQAVWELRRLAGWLRASGGAPATGILGAGFGGYTAALFAALDEGLASAVVATPVSSLAALLWRLLPGLRRVEARAAGLGVHQLDSAFARHSPLRVRPRVPHAARLLVAGRADRVCPPQDVAALWEHWGHPAVHWFPGGHLLWRGRDAARARIAAHLRDTLLAAGL